MIKVNRAVLAGLVTLWGGLFASAHAGVVHTIASVDFNEMDPGAVTAGTLSAGTTGASWQLNFLNQHGTGSNEVFYAVEADSAVGLDNQAFLMASNPSPAGTSEYARMTLDAPYALSLLESEERFQLSFDARSRYGGGTRSYRYALLDSNDEMVFQIEWATNGDLRIWDANRSDFRPGASSVDTHTALTPWDSTNAQIQKVTLLIGNSGAYNLSWNHSGGTYTLAGSTHVVTDISHLTISSSFSSTGSKGVYMSGLRMEVVDGFDELPDPEDLFDIFRAQFSSYVTRDLISDTQAQNFINAQQTDGTWTDIDYTDQTLGSWDTVNHLRRAVALSRVYVAREDFPNREDLRQAIIKSLEHWFEKDYSNPNWYWRRVGAPREAAEALVLMGDAVPEYIIQMARETSISDGRTSIDTRRTAQNRISMAEIELLKAWILKERDRMVLGADEIMGQIRTTRGEGIQPDYSYHMHQAMLQMRTYGFHTVNSMDRFSYVMRGTELAVPHDKMVVLRNFLLEGHSWFVWNGMYDYSGMARNLRGQNMVGTRIDEVMETMIETDPNAKEEYELRLQWPNELVGSKVFWRSDFAIHRRPDWYSSVRMKSTRLIGGENTNGNNNQGLHGASGVQLVHLTGYEYEEIAPLWTWSRLPGTTTDQGITDLVPPGRASMRGNSNFVGGLGDGSAGVSTMVYELDGFNARKAWFFEGDAVIALGAGIDGPTLGDVYTAVEQSRRSGTVASSIGNLSDGSTTLPGGGWVHHAGIGYKVNQPATVNMAAVNGNWNTIFSGDGSIPVSGEIFSIWINHGQSPQNDTYSYTIYPRTTADEMPNAIENHTTQVISNTVDLQATEGVHGLHAVFYTAGQVTMSDGTVLSVSAPCVVSLRGDDLLVCDPTRSQNSIDVTINQDTIRVYLPSGDFSGGVAQVEVSGDIPPPPGPSLAIISVVASADDGNVPGNTIDDDLNTRWAANGNGQYIQYELEEPSTVSEIRIAWYNGDQRNAFFEIETSINGEEWTKVYSDLTGSTSSLTNDLQSYDLTETVGQYVRITGYGNTVNSWNSITQVKIYGMDLPPPANNLQLWREHYFPDDLDDQSVSGPEASPAGDGVTNLMKYAMNLSPWESVLMKDLFDLSVSEEGKLVLFYQRRTDIDDVEYIIEVSEDLMDWKSGDPHVTEIVLDGGSGYEEIEARSALEPTATKGFIRLRVRHHEG